jgi:hypothetical protein
MKKTPGERWVGYRHVRIQSNPIIRSLCGGAGRSTSPTVSIVVLRFRNRTIPETYTQAMLLAYALVKWSASTI